MHKYAWHVHAFYYFHLLLQIHYSNFGASEFDAFRSSKRFKENKETSSNLPEARTHGMQQLAMVNGKLPQMSSKSIEHSTVTVRDVHKILEYAPKKRITDQRNYWGDWFFNVCFVFSNHCCLMILISFALIEVCKWQVSRWTRPSRGAVFVVLWVTWVPQLQVKSLTLAASCRMFFGKSRSFFGLLVLWGAVHETSSDLCCKQRFFFPMSL